MPESIESTAAPIESDAEVVESTETDAVEAEVDEPVEAEPARVFEPDAVLLESVDLARRALLEVTAPETVGSVVGHVVDDEHVLTLLFASDLAGYPGWRWSVTLARVEGAEPTVLETELMPGDAALLAPEWVPWSVRLAEYRAAQEAAAAAAAEAGGDADEEPGAEGGASDVDEEPDDAEDADDDFEDESDDEYEDESEDDLDDDAELDAAFGHDDGHDEFDGIDIDALDESAGEDDDDDESAVDDADDPADQPAEPSS